ncbi:conserved membrane hypothetical protein [Gammaproteobacteria bacterium]
MSTIPPSARKLALAWLIVCLTALIISGLFVILAIIAHIPKFTNFFTIDSFSRSALIVYFDQSVLIGFLSFCGVLWSLGESEITFTHRLALVFTILGCVAISITPFNGFSEPLFNNYVSLLRHPLFFGGIFLFGFGILFQVLLTLRQAATRSTWTRPDRLAALTTAFATLTAFLALAWTWIYLVGKDGQDYFEVLFWGCGHILQFVYTQLMVMAWLGLAAGLGLTLRISIRVLQGLIVLGVLPVLLVPVHYVRYAVDSQEIHHAFVMLMRHGGGLAAIPIGIVIFYGLLQRRGEISGEARPLFSALSSSLLLFSIGGVLGWMISAIHSLVPTHQHAFIGGTTLALMGLTYHLLPILEFNPPSSRLAVMQPWIYAIGQLLQIGVLAISGVVGIQYHAFNIVSEANTLGSKVAMGIMAFGGFIAAIGVILFVMMVVNALNHPRTPRW